MTDLAAARAAADRFGLEPIAIRPFGSGHINDTYLVETRDHDVVLQRLNAQVFTDPDAVTRNVLTVCRHVGALTPEPVPTHDGDWLVRSDGGVWRAWRRVPGAAPVDDLTVDAARRAARLLARFHVAVADVDPDALVETLPRFHDPRRRVNDLRVVVARDPHGRVRTADAEIERALAWSHLADAAAALTAEVPRRVAHFDAKLDNVLFRDGDAVCLVDLDTVMPGAWFWDVGDLVRTAATHHAEDDPAAVVDPALHRAVVDGYRSAVATVATPSELAAVDHAGAIVTFEQAVRFLTDWLDGDVYYRISRPDQNLDRARAQFGLLGSMPGTVASS